MVYTRISRGVILLLRLHYYLMLWRIHRIYYAALKMFKIFDSIPVDSSDDEDEIDDMGVKLWV